MRKNPIKLNIKEKEFLENVISHATINHLSKEKIIKIKVILMRNDNKTINDIIKETKLSKRTIINYTNRYLDNNRFFSRVYLKNESELSKQNVYKIFLNEPPLSYREAKERIYNVFHIDRSIIQVRNYLNRKNIYTVRSNHKLSYNERRKLKTKTKLYKIKTKQK